MSSKDKDRKRSNADESQTNKQESRDAKKVKMEESKVKITDAEIFNIEVEQSKHRNHTADLNTFKNTVSAIKESLNVIRQLKTGNDPTASAEILEQRIFSSLAIARLRKLNRLGHLGSAKAKDTTSEKRSKNDEYHLRLQNLLYEVGHLQKEINKCLEFRSKDEELTLVPVDKFYADAPADVSRPELTKDDPHEQRKSRLQWELEQRKMLSKELAEAKVKIEKSQTNIQTKESNLESLAPKLYKILEATRPVQEYFGMPYEQQKEQFQLAKYLPQPLFVLYRNLNALETQDKKGHLKALVEGDVDAAKTFAVQMSAIDEESDSDQEEETHKVSKHRRRMTSMHEEDTESRVLKKHPLHISLELQCGQSDARTHRSPVKLQLYFYYMTAMNTVTVKGSLIESVTVGSVASGDLIQLDNILSCLCSGDRGDVTPTSFGQSQLDKLTPSNIRHYKERIGSAYKWAQTISGINTLDVDVVEPKLANVSSLVKKVKKLVLDRVELVHQITELERCNLSVPAGSADFLPSQLPTSTLHHWSRCTYEDLSLLPHAADYIQTGAITSDHMIYQAKLTCSSARILAHVAVSGDYPASRPVVMIKLEDHRLGILTRVNSDAIMSIEREVNLGKFEQTENISNQLNLQLIRLAWCCDVLLAVLSLGTSQQNLVNIKFIPNHRRGRDRQLPLTYNPKTGFFDHD